MAQPMAAVTLCCVTVPVMTPKRRQRRGDPPLRSGALVLRGDALDPVSMADTARENFATYGFYGISVFVEANGVNWETTAATKLARAEWLAIFNARDLIDAGLELWDTGMSPHYDVVHEDRTQLVARMVGCQHRVVHNDYYEPPEGGTEQ